MSADRYPSIFSRQMEAIVYICPEMGVNEMHVPYGRYRKVSSFLKSRPNTHISVKYEVI